MTVSMNNNKTYTNIKKSGSISNVYKDMIYYNLK